MVINGTRLGVIACRYLVKGYYEMRYIAAPEIAEKYNMNVRALMPALRQLTRMGILHSRAGGREPGFIFTKDPQNITMYNIMSALEGDVRFNCCKELMPDLKCDCDNKKECGVHSLFNDVIKIAIKKLMTVSIADHAKSVDLDVRY